MDVPYGLNPYENDPGAWGASLLYNAEFVVACLDAAAPRSLAEVGAYAGDLTKLLLEWARRHDARVVAIDPAPEPELVQLERERGELELIRETSLRALEQIEMPDALVLDGDHNYYTVSEELRRVAARTEGAAVPLLMLHDVSWPHGRRDDYFDPAQVPDEHRQPVEPDGGLYPGVPGTWPGGLSYSWPAAREGGARNGVLTALEDFIEEQPQLRLAILPTFFGLGVVWHREAPYAEQLAEVLEPWDRNPLLARLERNRVLHLAASHVQLNLASELGERLHRAEKLLERMLSSRAFGATEMYLRLRERGKPQFSRAEIRALLDEPLKARSTPPPDALDDAP